MAWPDTPLVVEATLALGADLTANPTSWTFSTDVTTYTYDREGASSIVIIRGRANEATTAQPSALGLILDNRDGRFVARNPTGAYFPDLRKNTPLRVRVNPGTGLATRAVAHVSEWPPQWDVSETDHYVPVRADGVLRRLGQGQSPLRSAPYRYLTRLTGSDRPVAAWTLEDGPLAGVAAPLYGSYSMKPFVGTHPSGAVVSYPQWGQGSLGPWLPPVVSRSTGSGLSILGAPVTMDSTTTTWTVDLMYASGTDAGHDTVDGIAATVDINPSYLPGGALGWPQLIFLPDVQQIQVAMNGEAEVDATVPQLYDGLGHHLRWTVSQSGANVAWTVYVDGVLVQTDSTAGAMTLPAVMSIGLPATSAGGQIAEGYLAVWTTPPTLADAVAAALGYPGEVAGTRFARLCTEEDITAHVRTGSDRSMGPQGVETLLDLLRECEAAEQGLMVERVDGRLGFDPHTYRENAATALTLNYATGHVSPPLVLTDDDQLIRNDVTVTRTAGSFARVIDTDGPLGVTAVGRYDEGLTVNVDTDQQALDVAGWRVNLGTADGLRFPRITVDLRRNTSLIAAWLALDIGSRITITNLPNNISYDDVDLIVEGYAEQISQKSWIISFNCAPYSPYFVFVLDDDVLGRLETGGSELALDVTSGATSLLVATDGGSQTWINTVDHAAQLPFHVKLGGEVVEVTAISGSTTPQTFTVTRSINGVVKAQTAGTRIRLARVGV